MAMITTVQQHILQQQQEMLKSSGREPTGTFSWLLSGITLAAKMVEAKIRSAGLSDVLGAFGAENVQGEQQQKLDVYANQALLPCLGLRDSVAALVSEEDEEPVAFNRSVESGKYIIVFDPLNGSAGFDSAAWIRATRGGLRRLRPIDRAGLHHRPWRAWVHARHHHRRIRADQREHENARTGGLLQRERGQRRHLARRVSRVRWQAALRRP